MFSNRHDEKITPKDIYNTLWRCRDFELSHLWQRSVFLTAFIVLVYTGYGAVVLRMFTEEGSTSPVTLGIFTLISLTILLIGIMLSMLWIMMGKASKAWYERYESAIYKIEHSPKYAQAIVYDEMSDDEVMHGNLPLPPTIDSNIFTSNAGSFSPSRINIFIGHLSWFLCNALFICQVVIVSDNKSIQSCFSPAAWIILTLIFLIIYNGMTYSVTKVMVGSKTLR